jgi:two-component system KDP operon response regulator KdpE
MRDFVSMEERTPQSGDTIVFMSPDRERCRRLRALLGLCGWQLRRTNDIVDPGADVALVLFDADAMKMEARSAIRNLRRIDSTLPVVILATSAVSSDRALWIEAGARDTLTSACQPREFLARIWRCARTTSDSPVLRAGPITVYVLKRMVRIHDEQVALTKTEFAILVRLLRVGAVSHDEILVEVLGTRDRIRTSKVRYHVANLRRKLGSARDLIETAGPHMLRLALPGSAAANLARYEKS